MDENADPNGSDRQVGQYKSLEAKVNSLIASVATLSEMNTTANVLAQGFTKLDEHFRPLAGLPAQLAPLRNLAPERPPIPDAAGQVIKAVLKPMERPTFPGIGSLGMPEASVPFIGQPQGGHLAAGGALPQPPASLAAVLKVPGRRGANQAVDAAPTEQALGGGIKP